MSITRFRLSEYAKLSESERAERVQMLEEAGKGPLNGEMAHIDSEITALELRHQMSTATMLNRLAASTIDHTPDICRWQMLAEIRNRVARIQ